MDWATIILWIVIIVGGLLAIYLLLLACFKIDLVALIFSKKSNKRKEGGVK